MGAELGATGSLFPSDAVTKKFLAAMGRPEDYAPLKADPSATYDEEIVIDLSKLVPLAAQPHMPDRMATIKSLAGLKVDQSAIGSCTNSSYSDLKTVALMLKGQRVKPETDLFISPGSKQVLKMLADENLLQLYLDAGARILECTCGPCLGYGGSPTSGGVSARTFNRNFEGRSGTQDAKVYLVSPQTAAMAALNGEFTDPATWGTPPAKVAMPKKVPSIRHLFVFPPADGSKVEIRRGPNIAPPVPLRQNPGHGGGQGGPQGGRRHHHRPHPARRHPHHEPALQHPGHLRIPVHQRGHGVRGPHQGDGRAA